MTEVGNGLRVPTSSRAGLRRNAPWAEGTGPMHLSITLVRDVVGPGEVRAAAGNETQRGAADANELVGLELHRGEHRRRSQADDVGLAAVLQVEAALLLVVGDEGMLLARDRF